VHINFFLLITSSLCLTNIGVPIKDASIDDEIWEKGVEINNFHAIYPGMGKPSVDVKVYLLFDGEYLGIKFVITKKEPVISVSTIRDFPILREDCFGILLDSQNNKRSAYAFFVNPSNIQSDLYGDNAIESQDPAWDGEWYSKTKVFERGWKGIICIPIEILKFTGNEWGINLLLCIRRKQGKPQKEIITWEIPERSWIEPETFENLRLDLNIGTNKKMYSFIPYLVFPYPYTGCKSGIDIVMALHHGHSLNFTFNPDYAQIEGDRDMINITKTNPYLQEKRPFFMEKNDILSSLIELMYTRNIENIKYGLKYVGDEGGFSMYSFGILAEENDTTTDFFCWRTKKGIGKADWFGLYGTAKIKGKHKNLTASVDGQVELPFSSRLNMAIAKSYTTGLENVQNLAYRFDLRKETIKSGPAVTISLRDIQENFNPETGFLSMYNLRAKYINLSYTILLQRVFLQNLYPGIIYANWRKSSDDSLLMDYLNPYLGIVFEKLAELNLFFEKEYRFWEGKYYENKIYTINLNLYPSGKTYLSINYLFGYYYNQILRYPSISISMTPLECLSLKLSFDNYHIIGDENEDVERILVIKENWNITKKLSFRTFIQWTDLSEEIQANFLLSYDFSVDSHVYFVWNEIRDINEFPFTNRNLPLKERKLVAKICYCFKM